MILYNMQFNLFPFNDVTIDIDLLLMYLFSGVCLYDLLVGPFCIVQFVFHCYPID